ncbi:DNA mismatch repair protein Mlh3-like [Penaeus chinensis]|uniref:DNA mismatch repair protein Mlh3-like n=1 Tax=Penaeus chinensis TaxID=139456 RepID=UPI001FB811D4|nr:DNA mismatch repair protein Mlh3-like [Penaeus chinensis]XP_047500099.1 DNA mismatch repair protein Mlh3-like [Penaeus chinensis]
MSGKILPLSESVRSKLRSGITITSVAQCVEEMVLNSIDASATCIAIRIDPAIFRIQVVDNGDGVTEENLKLLGKRHATSKCHSLDDLNSNLGHYGFRGEAMASLVEVAAIVDITTRPRGSVQTLTKIFAYGKEKSISVAKVPRPSIGTTITVQDFMYNMPVRRKLMKEAIDIENIRVRLESFALIHPKISLSLRNDNGQSKVMHTNKSNSTLSTFMQLFGLEKSQGLVEVEHTVDQFTVTGYISVQPHLTKALQFIYVNKRVVLKTKIHKMMNYLLARTSIISNRLHPATPLQGKSPSSPPKGLKLHGIYVINIECPPKEYDICMDPTKTLVEFRDWDKLLLCIEEMVIKFAEEERLAISLDERFRRSGRDQGMIEEESQAEPHSSQALLQVFSLKRSGENSKWKGEPQEKYGRTLCTYDNLSAVHSIPVRRKNNEKKNAQRYNEIDSGDDDETVLRAVESKEIDDESCHPSEVCLSKETDDLNSERTSEICDNNSPPSSISKQNLSPRILSTRSPEKIQEAKNKVRSSLDMFRRMVTQSDSDTTSPHPSCEDQSVSKATVLRETGRSNSETHDEANNKDSNKKRSSLEEFKSFYTEDLKKCKQESYETPQELIRSPPREPPPLRVAPSPPTSTEDTSQDTSQEVSMDPIIKNLGGDEEQKEKKSLSKTLSEGWKKHQAKAKSLKCLQKFEFQRKSSNQSICINKSTSHEVAQRGKKSPKADFSNTEPKTRYQTRKSLHQKMKDSVTVQTSDSESDNDANGKALHKESRKYVDLDCSFKFQPVLESEIKEAKFPKNAEILDDTVSQTRLERSLGSRIVTLSKEPEEISTQDAVENDYNKCSEIGDDREEIQRFIPDENCVENNKNHEVHEPLISQTNDIEAFTTGNKPEFGHQALNESEEMKKKIFQTVSEQGEMFSITHTAKKNLDYYCKEISPTQPFVIEGISSGKKYETGSTQQVITGQSSNKVQDDAKESSAFLSDFIDKDAVDSVVKCNLRGNDLDVADAPKNVEQLKVCNLENVNDVNMKYVGEHQTICNSIGAYNIQEHCETLPLSKNNYPNTEVNFRLCESTSQLSSAEDAGTESHICNENVAGIRSSDEYGQMEMKSHNKHIQSPPLISSDNPGSQNPLSASLHFSELSIPSTRDSPSISQCASSLADTCNAKTLFGSSVPSLSSDSSCVTEKSESTKSKFPSYNIVFHGKMIHIDGKNQSAVPTDQGVCHTVSRETSPKQLEQNNSSLESENLLKKTSGKEKDDLEESDVPSRSSSDTELQNSEDRVCNKEATSKNNPAYLQEDSSYDMTHSSKANCITEHDPNQSTSNYLRNLWKEATDDSGRKVYINLQTGNTSYEAPVIKEMPEWTSSQPQGAPVLKIPLSEEPEAEGSHQKQDFVLTHGYSAFMSWKKRREMEKKKVLEKSEINVSGIAYDNSRDTKQDQFRQEAISKEGEECESLISSGMKEAIQSILQDSEMDDDSIKWSEKPSNLGSIEEDSSEVAQICQEWEPPTFAMDADILSSKVQGTGSERGVNKDSSVKIYNIVHPYKFSQEMLQTCKVLGQLDKKFIACEITYTSSDPTLHKVNEIIVLFDQHAVHERVRLETLTEENYESLENGERVIRTCMITPPLEMTLPESEVRLMMAYTRTFIQWGLHFTQVSASQVNFHAIPSILVARERHELRQRRCQSATAIIESIVRDVCYTLHQTGGVVSTMPKPLMNVLCSQACRGAIKFGDELSYNECENLVKSLSSCALPFQCAHGRPSIVPVVNLTHLAKGNKRERKPNLHKLREAIEEEMLGEENMD